MLTPGVNAGNLAGRHGFTAEELRSVGQVDATEVRHGQRTWDVGIFGASAERNATSTMRNGKRITSA